jgi:hypothetical protein
MKEWAQNIVWNRPSRGHQERRWKRVLLVVVDLFGNAAIVSIADGPRDHLASLRHPSCQFTRTAPRMETKTPNEQIKAV